jgi:hypothetical protein
MADGIKTTVSGDGLAKLRAVVQNLKNPAPFLAESVKVMRASVGEEFAGKFWKMPSGGRQPWAKFSEATKKMKGFQDHPLLEESGTLSQAWLGLNGYSLTKIDRNSASIGVQGLPYAALQRGGSGGGIASEILIPVTAKMRFFLGGSKGFWLKPDTASLRHVSRPQATGDPALLAKLQGMLLDFSLTRNLRDAGGRFRAAGA